MLKRLTNKLTRMRHELPEISTVFNMIMRAQRENGKTILLRTNKRIRVLEQLAESSNLNIIEN